MFKVCTIMIQYKSFLTQTIQNCFLLSAPDAYIIFTTDDGLMSTSLSGNVTSVPMATIRNASRSDALEFDYTSGTLYYTDGFHKNIWMMNTSSKEVKDINFPGQ